jgi:hypothetical protein
MILIKKMNFELLIRTQLCFKIKPIANQYLSPITHILNNQELPISRGNVRRLTNLE